MNYIVLHGQVQSTVVPVEYSCQKTGSVREVVQSDWHPIHSKLGIARQRGGKKKFSAGLGVADRPESPECTHTEPKADYYQILALRKLPDRDAHLYALGPKR